MMDKNLMNRAADNIRILITEMVEKAKSGHPGGSMGGADFVNVLFSKVLRYDPRDPEWMARDRFFLDPGHQSPMLYGVLALTGRYTIEELQQFRQWGSVTPGHPELQPERGVDNSSGPLGQGHAMAVGCAIAERFLAARFGEVVAHKTYAFISDGGIQEEVSQGAGRIAGTLGLSNLIMYYDANSVQLSTTVAEVTCEDTAAKYRAWNWNVLEIDGSDPEAIYGALEMAREEKEKPTLIIGRTIMARKVVASDGSSLEGAVSTHGQPLSKAGADIAATVRNLGGDPENPWVIFDEVKDLYERRREILVKEADAWKAEFHAWKEAHPEEAERLGSFYSDRQPELDLDSIEIKPNVATRTTSSAVLNYLGRHVGNMIVSSADLANSDKTDGFLKATGALVRHDFSGAFLHAGVAELTMACIMNGVVLHGGMQAACGTFFVFSDYMKPAIRMSALMQLPVKYVFSHDAFRVGEDGPTHQPVEHEAQMRLLEELRNLAGKRSVLVLRPADSAEVIECYRLAMATTDRPTVMIFSRQDLEDLPGADRREQAKGVARGGYIVYGSSDVNPDVTLVANGSEVSLALHVAEELHGEGVKARVVSVPSIGEYLDQPKAYRDATIPATGKVFGITSGLPSTLYPLMRGDWKVYGLDRFGASAPAKVLDEKFGYTTPAMLAAVKSFLEA
ncbi:MAG: transketolase [Muribaculaceae bacterium]|nr:transketolase [Muribaculaceae bacterium]